jgi:ubiquinone/menaquinone biosynthesis C-methylase UbiE
MKTKEVDDFYKTQYLKLQYSGISGWSHNLYHSKLEKGKNNKLLKLIELGAGNGEHFEYVKNDYLLYYLTDNSDYQIKELKKKFKGTKKVKIKKIDIQNIDFKENSFDRVIITCLLHHIPDLPKALDEVRRISKSGGLVTIYLPCDPGILYRFTRFIAMINKRKIQLTGQKIIKRKYLASMEHPNHVLGIANLIAYYFKNDEIKVKRFPTPFPLWNLNLYYVYNIRIIK